MTKTEFSREHLLKTANALAIITVFYNVLEGLFSILFGLHDESLSLFGFGVDSFVEVISGIGIWHMITRIRANANETRDDFEKRSLKITGSAFYVLFVGLIVTAFYNIITNHKPEATFWGIVISVISIMSMYLLIKYKLKVGLELNSAALIADANCTRTCLYLSFVLLVASLGYTLTGLGGIDSVGAISIAYFAFKEGREAFEKAKTGKNCGCSDDHCKT